MLHFDLSRFWILRLDVEKETANTGGSTKVYILAKLLLAEVVRIDAVLVRVAIVFVLEDARLHKIFGGLIVYLSEVRHYNLI